MCHIRSSNESISCLCADMTVTAVLHHFKAPQPFTCYSTTIVFCISTGIVWTYLLLFPYFKIYKQHSQKFTHVFNNSAKVLIKISPYEASEETCTVVLLLHRIYTLCLHSQIHPHTPYSYAHTHCPIAS